ncbi:hypothetical protein LINPERHAP1_LOCUS31256 [Linum perenne]
MVKSPILKNFRFYCYIFVVKILKIKDLRCKYRVLGFISLEFR